VRREIAEAFKLGGIVLGNQTSLPAYSYIDQLYCGSNGVRHIIAQVAL